MVHDISHRVVDHKALSLSNEAWPSHVTVTSSILTKTLESNASNDLQEMSHILENCFCQSHHLQGFLQDATRKSYEHEGVAFKEHGRFRSILIDLHYAIIKHSHTVYKFKTGEGVL